ncbi:uncharacterized protein PRCAT00000761001 [Priceomyces carsonii]|uniref:uncharacterized protein n=1 Tax=Priceomyces carsonii TaxID=28549 RepID=UPI002ED98985|nr:unnamed protein product [Priceomyces carsonii]
MMTTLPHTTDSFSSKSDPVTFGLSKDLDVPIILKVCYLQQAEKGSSELATSSAKFENPLIFQKLSNIFRNSELFVKVYVYDCNNTLVSIPVQTSYTAFSGKKRLWNQYLKLAINYNQLTIDGYLKLSLYEIVNTKPVEFGVGYLSIFNKNNATLRKGSQKVPIYITPTGIKSVEYGDITGLTEIEKNLIKYENGEFSRIGWLDKLVIPEIERAMKYSNVDDTTPYHLYVELPNFELPIVFSDITYNFQSFKPSQKSVETTYVDASNTNVINSIDIPTSKRELPMGKVYDPDFDFTALSTNQNNSVLPLNPIEMKYHKLERNINNNSILDKEIKPSPQIRDELMKILLKPSNVELNDTEKNLIWKFRYFFSKNNSISDKANKAATTKSFLPKFLKSINWDNDYELDHVFNEIIPHYWSVERIQIGDAMELLDNYFNPYNLTSTIISQSTNIDSNKDNKRKNDEERFIKIFQHVTFLRKFAVDRLKLASSDELLLYLLQLVQALRYESWIYDKNVVPFVGNTQNFQMIDELNSDNNILRYPLAKFLIDRSIKNETLGNFFYWYVKVENEDQINNPSPKSTQIYSLILNKYIEALKKHSQSTKSHQYKNLKRQIWFIKKLTGLVELLRTTFRRNEATIKKIQFLREYLSDSSNELLKISEPFPLPLDPSVTICGCYPEESSVFKSSLAPLKITFKTIEHSNQSSSSQIFGKKSQKHGKYTLMFKIGDDLRQDQLVIQIINLMDQLLKNENLDLRLTPYKILATSPIAGLIQFVPNETLDSVLSETYPPAIVYNDSTSSNNAIASRSDDNGTQATGTNTPNIMSNNGILCYLRLHSQEIQSAEPEGSSVLNSSQESLKQLIKRPQHTISSDLGVSSVVMDNYVKSCAGYCVITYLLGVGDRHLDNLLLSPNGKFWHADFGYILGRDPKPFPPLMKLPIQVIDGMGGMSHENFKIFKSYCFITYTTLRKNSNLILNLFQLMLDANIPDIQMDPRRAVEKVQEKFCLEMTEEEAIIHFQTLINDSVNAFLPVVIDRLHSLAQYWRA